MADIITDIVDYMMRNGGNVVRTGEAIIDIPKDTLGTFVDRVFKAANTVRSEGTDLYRRTERMVKKPLDAVTK